MELIEKFRIRIEFEKKQALSLFNEGKLTNELLKTYTRDTISFLIDNYNQDLEFVKVLQEIRSELSNNTRIICLDVPTEKENVNEREHDTVIDFMLDENTVVSEDEIMDETYLDFEEFEETIPGIDQCDIDRIKTGTKENVFCHIGYKVENQSIYSKSENQDYVYSQDNFLIVCDGVGSGINSKKISEFVATQYAHFIDSFYYNIVNTNEISRSAFIQQGAFVINKQIRSLIENCSESDKSSGTTLASAIRINRNTFHISSVGDSPIYKFDLFKGLSQISTDDSLLNKLQSKGFFVNSPEENMETLNFLARMWPNENPYNLIHIARQCIVKSFGLKQEGVLFSSTNNKTIHIESTSGLILCTDGICDQFEINGLVANLQLGGIKKLIKEFNLVRYHDCFGVDKQTMMDILTREIFEFTDFYEINSIYSIIISKLFNTYGHHLIEVVLKGGINQLSKESLNTMQQKRMFHTGQPFNGYKKPKPDNIGIGYIF